MKKIVLGALAGAVAMFIWGAVAHMALGIGDAAFKKLPAESVVTAAIDATIDEDGFYVFPFMTMDGSATKEEEAAWKTHYENGPTGMLLFRQGGRDPQMKRELPVEFLSNLLAALAAAMIASMLQGSYVRRVLAITLLGVVGWASLSLSTWNWYGFPTEMMTGDAIEQIVGWFLSGLLIARIVPGGAGS